ncbi:MAG: type II toxin-antitoxin system RelE/ParE family toxin [Candidatus Eremiobacterota bacterium]
MTVKISKQARKDIFKLDKTIIHRIYKAIGKMRKDIARFKRLKGAGKTNSLRVGNYRIIFDVTGDSINILNVEHRREVYRDL